jgi:hypothetical protein
MWRNGREREVRDKLGNEVTKSITEMILIKPLFYSEWNDLSSSTKVIVIDFIIYSFLAGMNELY